VPDASVAINIGASFTYYYLAPDAGTYFWHCHITPPEHLQMGMVGQLYVRPRQNRVAAGAPLYAARQQQMVICAPRASRPPHPVQQSAAGCERSRQSRCQRQLRLQRRRRLDLLQAEYPLQIHGFDPNFHFVA